MKMPEPVAWSITVGDEFKNCVEITHNRTDADGRLAQLSRGGFGAIYTLHNLYDKQALIDLLEAAAREASYYENHSITAKNIAAAIRSMKEKL